MAVWMRATRLRNSSLSMVGTDPLSVWPIGLTILRSLGPPKAGVNATARRNRMPVDVIELSVRLAHLQSCTVGDVLDEMGLPNQVLAAGIRAISPGMNVAGPAFCISGREISVPPPPAASRGAKPGYEMFRHM